MERFFGLAQEAGLGIVNAVWSVGGKKGSVITHPTPMNLYSVTKAFTAIATGFAVEEGVFGLGDRITALCPELKGLAAPGAEEITVYHLLTMTHGHKRSLLMPGQRERFTEKNYAAYFIREPMAYMPGSRFVYCNGCSYLLGYVLSQCTGQSLKDYLASRLFAPLGIKDYHWETCPMGLNTGGQGLFLKTEDIFRFGELFLNNGGGILSSAWLRAMTRKHVDSDWAGEGTGGYGYQVWLNREGRGFRAEGTMGQFLWVDEKKQLLLAVNAKEPTCASGNEPFYKILRSLYDTI